MLYTITQHSGWGYGDNSLFTNAVESHAVTTKAQERRVIAAGGLIFEDCLDAEDFCEHANYVTVDVDGEDWLIPHAQGTFSTQVIGGLAIYIPVREAVG